MVPRVSKGTIIFRRWGETTGLDEESNSFHSIDELFSLCLHAGDPQLVDRIILRGVDDQGEPRTLTFTFQSLRIGDEA